MHRKLLHSFRALGIALGLLTAGLIADSLVVDGMTANSLATAPGTSGQMADADATVSPTPAASAPVGITPKPFSRHRKARGRDSLALPFYSFAQGLRSGNGS